MGLWENLHRKPLGNHWFSHTFHILNHNNSHIIIYPCVYIYISVTFPLKQSIESPVWAELFRVNYDDSFGIVEYLEDYSSVKLFIPFSIGYSIGEFRGYQLTVKTRVSLWTRTILPQWSRVKKGFWLSPVRINIHLGMVGMPPIYGDCGDCSLLGLPCSTLVAHVISFCQSFSRVVSKSNCFVFRIRSWKIKSLPFEARNLWPTRLRPRSDGEGSTLRDKIRRWMWSSKLLAAWKCVQLSWEAAPGFSTPPLVDDYRRLPSRFPLGNPRTSHGPLVRWENYRTKWRIVQQATFDYRRVYYPIFFGDYILDMVNCGNPFQPTSISWNFHRVFPKKSSVAAWRTAGIHCALYQGA